MEFRWVKREFYGEYGKEIILEKRYSLFKDQWKNRLFVLQPNDPRLKGLAV